MSRTGVPLRVPRSQRPGGTRGTSYLPDRLREWAGARTAHSRRCREGDLISLRATSGDMRRHSTCIPGDTKGPPGFAGLCVSVSFIVMRPIFRLLNRSRLRDVDSRFSQSHDSRVDDVASSDEEAAAALRELLAQDTRQIIATPHVKGSLTLRRETIEVRLRGRWAALARRGREFLVGSQRRPPERAAGGCVRQQREPEV